MSAVEAGAGAGGGAGAGARAEGSKRSHGGGEGEGESGAPEGDAGSQEEQKEEQLAAPKKKAKVAEVAEEEIRPVAAPVRELALEVPQVSEADVGKMVLSETSDGALTGVVEGFTEEDGLGVWSIR